MLCKIIGWTLAAFSFVYGAFFLKKECEGYYYQKALGDAMDRGELVIDARVRGTSFGYAYAVARVPKK